MYSPSNESPLESYQVITPSNNSSNFTTGTIIRFQIPRSLGYIDPMMSMVQFLVNVTDCNYKMCFVSPYAGVASMIQSVRLSQNGKMITEILDYNQIVHSLKCYEMSDSVSQKEALTKGLVDYAGSDNTAPFSLSKNFLLGQSVHQSGQTGAVAMAQDVKFTMFLDYISLFDSKMLLPICFIGDLILEIELVQSVKSILKVLPTTTSVFTSATGSQFITNEVDILVPPILYKNLASSPFILGQVFHTCDTNGDNLGLQAYTITGLSQDDTTCITTMIYTPAVVASDNGKNTFVIVKGSDGLEAVKTPSFKVSKAELHLQVVKPSPQYTLELADQISKMGQIMDFDNFCSYRNTILAGVKNQQIVVPTTQSRSKGIFLSMRKTNQSLTFDKYNSTDFDYNGKYGDLLSYQSQIDGKYYPTQQILLSNFLGNWSFSQEHVRELLKTFDSVELYLANMCGLKQNFLVGRALSSYKSTTDLTGTPITTYLNYNGNGPNVYDVSPSDIVLDSAGLGYFLTPAPYFCRTVALTGEGSGMKIRVSAINGSGGITGAVVSQTGSGYKTGDKVSVLSDAGNVLSVISTIGGTGYGVANDVATVNIAGSGVGLTINITAVNGGIITGFTVNDAGLGYIVGDTFTVAGGGSDGEFSVESVGGQLDIGNVKTAGLTSGGTGGYAIALDVATTNVLGSGVGLKINITSVSGGGVITGFVINGGGTGYEVGNTFRATGGAGDSLFTITAIGDTLGVLSLTYTSLNMEAISFLSYKTRMFISGEGIEVSS